MGLELFVENPEDRLPTVTTVKVPEGVNWKDVASHMMYKVREKQQAPGSSCIPSVISTIADPPLPAALRLRPTAQD